MNYRLHWFRGETSIKTYQLNELMGSKMRALYQRQKGRDLFDLWIVLQKLQLDPAEVIKIFLHHMKQDKQKITRALFEKNLKEKAANIDFQREVNALIRPETNWNFNEAYEMVLTQLISHMPGESWKEVAV